MTRHRDYGPCDTLGPQGECSECARRVFSVTEFRAWLRSRGRPTHIKAARIPDAERSLRYKVRSDDYHRRIWV